ncbi:MAG: hypothetical protein KBC95_00630 [Candidatus Peribacteraceae bacterium]|nr:hypothetical protein [Candidatus Peribacteraceae bacterium]
MLLSTLFTKTSKESSADAQSINADLLTRAGYVHKTMAGVYSFLPLGLRVLRRVEQVVREEMDAIGGQELLLSALAPKETWMKTGRWDTLDVLFKSVCGSDSEVALNPTHEEVVSPLAASFVASHKDLPFACYQIQTKFRNEPRAKSGIMRGREFLMKDLYSFHKDQADLERFYAIAQAAYLKVFERLGLASKTYLTYASGGSFSKYSHEYQVILPNGEDTIYVSIEAEKHGQRIAVNKEIYEPGVTTCPVTGGTEFREERASEAGNIFQLGTRFSEPFGLQFTDATGVRQTAVMGCYGIGVSRLMGIIAEAFSDKSGLVWPKEVAPAEIIITPIAKEKTADGYTRAFELYDRLQKRGVRCLLDDRIEGSTGSRLADADLLGIPTRALVSEKSLAAGGVEVKTRATGEVVILPLDAVGV